MDFFKQLAAIGDIDLSIRIMQKGDKLTINVMPGSNASVLKPILVTGTADELDSEFFPTVFPAVQHLTGLATNFNEVKKDIESKIAEKAKPKEDKPASKKEEKKVVPAKKETKPSATEPDLFGDEDKETTVKVRTCRVCGCTENNCSQCIEKTGSPCTWVDEDLCSACIPVNKKDDEDQEENQSEEENND